MASSFSGRRFEMFELIHRQFARSKHVEVIDIYATERGRVRLILHCDPYDFQSWGRTQLWDGSKWNEIYTLPGTAMKTLSKTVCYGKDWQTPAYYMLDIETLLQRTSEVLQ